MKVSVPLALSDGRCVVGGGLCQWVWEVGGGKWWWWWWCLNTHKHKLTKTHKHVVGGV